MILLAGPPGTGKTFTAETGEYSPATMTPGQVY